MILRSTINFLSDLAENNDRTWFLENKDTYDLARANAIDFTEACYNELRHIDPAVPDIQPKRALMRIYRDVRFSKNKDPYKKNFGIWFPASSAREACPGYYIHLQPNASFVGAGYWMPGPEHLKCIRQEIDYSGQLFDSIDRSPEITSSFTFNFSGALKNAPKGYEANHPYVHYLKLKSFELSKTVANADLFDPNLVKKIGHDFKTVLPYIDFLREAISS